MLQFAQIPQQDKVGALLAKAGLKGKQIAEAVQFTYDSVLHVLKEQLQRGNLQEVLAILKGKPMAIGKKLVKEEITGRVVKGLMLRFGLRKIVALGIAALLIPFIIGKIAQQIILKGTTVSDLIFSLQIKTRLQDLFNSGAEIQQNAKDFSISNVHTNEEDFLTD